jgi:hypothetical protein
MFGRRHTGKSKMFVFLFQMFHRCQRLVHQIGNKSKFGTAQEQKLTVNVTSSLARGLQDLSTNFRQGQSKYLKSEWILYHYTGRTTRPCLWNTLHTQVICSYIHDLIRKPHSCVFLVEISHEWFSWPGNPQDFGQIFERKFFFSFLSYI